MPSPADASPAPSPVKATLTTLLRRIAIKTDRVDIAVSRASLIALLSQATTDPAIPQPKPTGTGQDLLTLTAPARLKRAGREMRMIVANGDDLSAPDPSLLRIIRSSLLALGIVWLWQSGHVWIWAIAAAALGLLAWPLARRVRRRANAKARVALGDRAEPSRAWNVREREAWSDVLAIAEATAPFSFTEIDTLVASARQIIETVAGRLHPETHSPWAQFSVPEVLLLTERVSRDLRREALRTIPGIRIIKLGHVLWLTQKIGMDRYGVWATAYGGSSACGILPQL